MSIEPPEILYPPFTVPWPGPLHPIQSVFITNRNQPPPPILASVVFPPPQWPLDEDDWQILPVIGPIMALTPAQVAPPIGFGLLDLQHGDPDPSRRERQMQRAEGPREERFERRGRRRRNGNGDGERPNDDWSGPAE